MIKHFVKSVSLVVALGLAAIVTSSPAQADFMGPGVQAVADLGSPTLVGSNDINLATGFNFGSLVTTAARSGGFLALGVPQFLTSTTFTVATPGTFTFGNAVFGFFTGTTANVLTQSVTSRTFNIDGFFTPGVGFGGGTSHSANLTVSFTQVDGPGTPISDSLTLRVSAVPEPASMAMLAMGGLGVLGAARRRKATV